jgi:hypothetical protein
MAGNEKPPHVDCCRHGHARGRVINSRRRKWFRVRRYRCHCGARWTTYEMRFRPRLHPAKT